jgi:hypothetical protein
MSKEKKVVVKKNLIDAKSSVRRKASIEIGNLKMNELGDDLFQAYLEERKDVRTWETQMEMVKALGLIDYKKALEEVKAICEENEKDSMLTIIAAQAYVRLKRKSINDASPAIELLKFGGHSIAEGTYDALGYDKMLPSDEEIIQLIKLSEKVEFKVQPQFDDPRYGLAAAAAGWRKDLVSDFLSDCLLSSDEPLKYVAANALKGKYVKLR